MKKRKILLYVSTLLFTLAISFFGNNMFKLNDCYQDGHWFSTPELAPNQTWPEYWQADINNPYNSETMKAHARWIITHGYDNMSPSELKANGIWATMKAEVDGSSSSTSSNTPSASSSPSTQTSQSNTTTSSKATNSNTSSNSPTLTKGDYGIYVILSKKAVYSSYTSDKQEIGSLSKGTELSVTGDTTNGYYQFTFTKEDGSEVEAYLLHKGKDNIVDKDTYDAAWALTNTVEATCTKDGYEEYTNSLSGLTKKEEIKATGHTLGDEELIKEPGIFTKGEIVTHCANCNEVMDTRYLDSYIPVWVLYILCVAAGLFVLFTLYKVITSKKNNNI